MAKAHYKETITDKQKKTFAPFLAEDEELVLITGYGSTYLKSLFVIALLWPGMIPFFLALGIAKFLNFDLIIAFILGIILMVGVALLKTMHTNFANRYMLTTRRVIIKKSVFAVQLTSALYDKITHIEVEQSFWDKILMHHGTLKINTAGMSTDQIILRYVDYPIEFKNLLERLINREREMFGLRSGSAPLEGEIL